ncbi:ATP-dependent DNA helicase RecG [Deinococcus soli (ex Cha et al. 2016)]|uniref:ATP-dependent DNA helicase RecG n=2 Tax=Deinococcus soli (ex Cha et al. 2016) TaxID=1309411 RepID=A0AAE3XFC1_9DEIO|nr:ATP-dependent DNA helicase RecG [Deinococcus soli (ex Cha et al. 2016)]MDR6218683.1 ATP-dependent DNA helicase RecG [Deinococcus soli (ex Cha et al. 2016)]MDR6328480.1 ATP-dependent DNA helicase RecG [Deinococcus soli (ex Cha et al. 2016)]MDR6753091.1 ATP-dependent DNA helicase RecG [Deinococcus soli (ex Cha et al. 2016)]
MANVQDMRERLRRPLEHELRTGCANRTVSGGIEKLLEHLAMPFPQVRETLRDYANLSPERREEKLRAALVLLAPEHARAAKAPTRSAPEPSVTPSLFGDVPAPRPPGRPASRPARPSPAPAAPAAPAPAAASPARTALDELLSGPRWTLDQAVADIPELRSGARKLHALGLRTVRDVLHHYPRRHEDRRVMPNIRAAEDGQKFTVLGTLISKARRSPKPGMTLTEAVIEDSFGQRVKCTWFNQPWVERQLREGARLIVTGRVKRFGSTVQVSVETFESEDQSKDSLSTGRIIGVYDTKDGTSQDFLRKVTYLAVHRTDYPDHLSSTICARWSLTTLKDALLGMHFPEDEAHLTRAMERLRFDEYLFLELRILLQGEQGVLLGKRFHAREEDIDRFERTLPFKFTGAQRRVLSEIARDMRDERQMARLVQGDVGSGKTAVAACAVYLATRDGYQGALMAPTEILARQHYANLQNYLYPLGVRVGLMIGALTPRQKAATIFAAEHGELDVIVGTQALIQDGVIFNNLGIAVVDEEHRFGVQQRRSLLKNRPDVLVMSATPIPRSLALTAYGDLELSIIDELPPGRTPIETKMIADHHRAQAYAFVMTQLNEGRQAYVVASLIEENETLADLRAATDLAEEIRTLLPDARVALLHGKMSAQEKDAIMASFKALEFNLLVSTTVIEVGVDVPNSTVMIIENAERFGLAQLHQLRGRVGRGALQSYCILVAGDTSAKTKKRLKVIENSTDGFVIAEADLKIRGPGEIRGTRQSGIPDLKLGDIVSDAEVIEQARDLAKAILSSDATLEHPKLLPLKTELQSRAAQVAYRDVI